MTRYVPRQMKPEFARLLHLLRRRAIGVAASGAHVTISFPSYVDADRFRDEVWAVGSTMRSILEASDD